ncbi:MAG: hypothetical protein HC882_09070 [Acidobacteria bacterium]|nr:hypothetical protein [Acidobacteriota bacterium]
MVDDPRIARAAHDDAARGVVARIALDRVLPRFVDQDEARDALGSPRDRIAGNDSPTRRPTASVEPGAG